MTAEHDLERRLSGQYAASAPARAPDWLLEQTLLAIDATPQRRALIRSPWRFPTMSTFAKFATAAVAVIAIGAISLVVLRPGDQSGLVGGAPSAVPSPSSEPSPPPSAGSVQRTASGFAHPFTYRLPADTEFELVQTGGPAYFEARVPAFWEDLGLPSGLYVESIGGGRTDPCDPSSEPLPIDPGGQAVVAYLGTIASLEVSDVSEISWGGLTALQATVSPRADASCAEVWPWSVNHESLPPSAVRMIAADVGGDHVVLTVYGEAANPAWAAVTGDIVDSIRFIDEAAPTTSP